MKKYFHFKKKIVSDRNILNRGKQKIMFVCSFYSVKETLRCFNIYKKLRISLALSRSKWRLRNVKKTEYDEVKSSFNSWQSKYRGIFYQKKTKKKKEGTFSCEIPMHGRTAFNFKENNSIIELFARLRVASDS